MGLKEAEAYAKELGFKPVICVTSRHDSSLIIGGGYSNEGTNIWINWKREAIVLMVESYDITQLGKEGLTQAEEDKMDELLNGGE